ncbi:MAG: hypothetical protein HY877_06960 [Deltaproteobacteria bacterium]|nr:hypothetical protein [Deltaproteobacteria bacterium]
MEEDKKNPVQGMFDAVSGENPQEKTSVEEFSKQEKLTAEEKLLQVIDSGGEPETEKKSWLKIAALKGTVGKAQDWFFQFKEGLSRPCFDLGVVNKGLAIVIGLVVIASVVNVFALKSDIKDVYARVAKHNTPSGGRNIALLESVEMYLKDAGKRSLFRPGELPKKEENIPTVSAAGADKILGDLQLVGIAWGEYPEAMIRDKADGRTYFLKKDQQFKGIKIKEISKDKVLVEYGGKNKELM